MRKNIKEINQKIKVKKKIESDKFVLICNIM